MTNLAAWNASCVEANKDDTAAVGGVAAAERITKTDAPSIYTCDCGSSAVDYYQQQTRGADEPMTTFLHCTACGRKWRE